jgi:ATP-dependent DNA helicase RecQ
LEVFIRESKLEDFLKDQKDTIFVSTIHKAKGREYDNIILMLNGFSPSLDEEIRQIYVGMTRAKNNLIIHTNSNYFDGVNVEGIKRIYDRKAYEAPSQIVIQLTHRDIWLDYFYSRQNQILGLVSGDELIANDEGCSCINNQQVLKYSKSMASQIAELKQKGYSIKKANVRFVVFWQKEDADKEIKIILPKLVFEKL